jgi:pimeloyl-ACP methyl ester carboxylesterase
MSTIISFQDVEVHIEGDGAETILMVHGWPDTYRVWDGQVEHLKGRYRCVRFTLPGFAAADVRRTYSLNELTGLIKQIVEHVAPGQKVILMLHDWGCIFGYEFYMRNPHLVSKIVGVDVGDKASVTQSRSLVDWVMVLSYQGWLAMAWIIGGPIGDWIARAIARAGGCPVPREHIGSRMTYPYFMEWFGGRQSYRRQGQPFIPACPILFIYGRRKPFMFHAKAWAEGLLASKGNRVEEFDTGHWVMLGQPDRFNEVVDDWLSAPGVRL